MGFTVSIDVDGVEEAERRLQQIAAQMLDLRPFWPKLVPLFVEWMSLQFETEGAFGGLPWAPLSPNYYAWKQRVAPGKGILILHGALRMSASKPQRDMTPDSLTLTILDTVSKNEQGKERVMKVEWHQYGTQRMPARPLIFETLPALAMAQVDKAAEEYVNEVTSRFE